MIFFFHSVYVIWVSRCFFKQSAILAFFILFWFLLQKVFDWVERLSYWLKNWLWVCLDPCMFFGANILQDCSIRNDFNLKSYFPHPRNQDRYHAGNCLPQIKTKTKINWKSRETAQTVFPLPYKECQNPAPFLSTMTNCKGPTWKCYVAWAPKQHQQKKTILTTPQTTSTKRRPFYKTEDEHERLTFNTFQTPQWSPHHANCQAKFYI